jgi:ankyrin repeat protein
MYRLSFGVAMFLAGGVVFASPAKDAGDRFYQVIRNNRMEELHRLVEKPGPNQRDAHGGTPLHYAAAYGSMDALILLVTHGAQVNATNDFGVTPLMLAIGEPAKATFLVGHGADVNARSKMGRTPLLLAAFTSGASETVRLFLEHNAIPVRDDSGVTPLLAAAYANDGASMRLLMEHGGGVNDQDKGGFTPLMYAAVNGNVDAVQLLLAHGSAVNAVTGAQSMGTVKNGPIALGALTPLMLAAPRGPSVIELLIQAGANVDAQDVRGMTPLMWAIATDHADARGVALLLKNGADLEKRDKSGLNARGWAARYNSPALLQALQMEPQATSTIELAADNNTARDARQAAGKAVALLERTSASFFREGGCAGCHAQNMTAMAVTAAKAAGIPVHDAEQVEALKGALAQAGAAEQPLLQRADPPTSEILSFALLQFAASGWKGDRTTDAMIYNLAAQQREDGSWSMGIARPPMGDGDFSRTATGIRALALFGFSGRQADFQNRIERAARWLATATPQTTEEHSMQLLGLHWAGKDSDLLKKAGMLTQQQRDDGGWGQTPDLPSDAYATGEALYALHEIGVSADSAVYRRAVEYLLCTQADDGSWHVTSRAAKIQPYFESGFPYGHDQWISSAGTAWAAMALSSVE